MTKNLTLLTVFAIYHGLFVGQRETARAQATQPTDARLLHRSCRPARIKEDAMMSYGKFGSQCWLIKR